MTEPTVYTCDYCLKDFKQLHRFEQHRCKQMIRAEQMRTPTGLAGLGYFQEWMRIKRKCKADGKMFEVSKHFEQFINFTTFVQQVGLSEPKYFISWCAKRDFTPDMWTSSEVYGLYLEHLDALDSTDVDARLKSSQRMLTKLANALDCDIEDVFNKLHPSDITLLLQTRKLSPWILLRSKKFMNFLGNCSEEEQQVIENLIRPEYWQKRIKQDKAAVEKAVKLVKELNL